MQAIVTWEVLVLRVVGEVDLATIARLRERLHEDVPGAYRVVVLDFTGVSVIAACGINLLVEIADQARSAGIVLRLVAPKRAVRRALEVTGTDKLLPPIPTVAQAISDLPNSATEGNRQLHQAIIDL